MGGVEMIEFNFKRSRLFIYKHELPNNPRAGWKFKWLPRFRKNPCTDYDIKPGECFKQSFTWLWFSYQWDLNK